jgi:hypothetical protein
VSSLSGASSPEVRCWRGGWLRRLQTCSVMHTACCCGCLFACKRRTHFNPPCSRTHAGAAGVQRSAVGQGGWHAARPAAAAGAAALAAVQGLDRQDRAWRRQRGGGSRCCVAGGSSAGWRGRCRASSSSSSSSSRALGPANSQRGRRQHQQQRAARVEAAQAAGHARGQLAQPCDCLSVLLIPVQQAAGGGRVLVRAVCVQRTIGGFHLALSSPGARTFQSEP